MALPKINNAPKYEIVIPSTGQKVRYRPYMVKEEKILMLAMESEDQNQIFNAIADTIVACIDGDVDRNKLTTFDIEYMFIQIRSKSVGENIDLNLKCMKCENNNEVSIKLDDINVEMPKISNIIKITDDVSIQMSYPTFNNILNGNILEDGSPTTQTFNVIAQCIDVVLTDDERIIFKDETKEEQMSFIESLSSEQFNGIKLFMEKMPSLQHDVEYTCSACQHENKITLQGMNDFF